MKRYVGIDLGTTNTVASVLEISQEGELLPRVIDLGQFNEDYEYIYDKILPSCLYVDKSGNQYVGRIAQSMKVKEPERVIYNSKNYIGTPGYFWEIDKKLFSPEEVAALILKEAKQSLEREIGEEIVNAVITVPASFNHDQIRATKKAAKMAGFDEQNTYFISEPTAALLDFINTEKKLPQNKRHLDFSQPRKMLVFDLGGGTCDVSILEVQITDKDFIVEEIAISSHTLVGGINFDLMGSIYLLEKCSKEMGDLFDNENEKRHVYNRMVWEMEKARKFFSISGGEEVIYENIVENFIKGKPYKFKISSKEYEECIRPLLVKEGNMGYNVVDPILDTLEKAGLMIQDIDDVLLTGGMSNYKPVRNAIEKLFMKKALISLHTMFSVARGAAIYHYLSEKLNKGNNNIKIEPVLASNIYIDIKNGLPFLIVSQGTKAPYEKEYDKILRVTNATGMRLDVFSGKNLWDPKMKRLKSVQLNFSELIKPGTPISLKVSFDRNRILTLGAWVVASTEQRVQVAIGEESENYEH